MKLLGRRAIPRCVLHLQVLLALFLGGLIACSWPLWTPQSHFPQIPLKPGFVWTDGGAWTWLGVFGLGCLLLLAGSFRHRQSRIGGLLLLTAGLALILEDQHRAQPWLVQSLWLGFLIFLMPQHRLRTAVTLLTASIYFYSAISKANPLFLEHHGKLLLEGLLRVVKLEPSRLTDSARYHLPYLFPAVELCIAIGLLWSKSRQLAATLAMVMHFLLIAVFSPWGLDHEWGVIVWNGMFVALAMWIWTRPDEIIPPKLKWDLPTILFVTTCTIIVVFPLGRFVGVVDEWMGWSLYSPRSKVVQIELLRPASEISPGFPHQTRKKFGLVQGDAVAEVLAADRWSLEQLKAPLNPQPRLEYAVALALCERFDAWESVAVSVEHRSLFNPSDREKEVLRGKAQIEQYASGFYFNTKPGPRFRTAR